MELRLVSVNPQTAADKETWDEFFSRVSGNRQKIIAECKDPVLKKYLEASHEFTESLIIAIKLVNRD